MRIGPIMTRRVALALATFAASSPLHAPLLALPASAAGAPSDDVLRKLSRVPVFVVTNSKDAPYLTEVDEQSRRSGFFYLGPQEALAALNDIKAFDPKASLSVVSLESVYFDISKSAVEAASAPQPTAGTSTDLRLFRLRPLQDSAALADREKDATLKPDDVPLYYDVSLLLTVDGTAQRPYFFRLQDLKRTYEQQSGKKLANLPSLSVTTLDALVQSLQAGDKSAMQPSALLVAASEAAAVVERMSAGSTSSLGGAQGDGAQGGRIQGVGAEAQPRGLPEAPKSLGDSGDDPFYLNVPFGGGKI
jgi:hypothetical protein